MSTVLNHGQGRVSGYNVTRDHKCYVTVVTVGAMNLSLIAHVAASYKLCSNVPVF